MRRGSSEKVTSGVEGSAYDPVVEVGETGVEIDKLAEPRPVDAYGHGVDGKVAARDVVGQSAVFDDRVAAFAAVALAARSDKFELKAALTQSDLSGAIGLEHSETCLAAKLGCHSAGQINAAPHRHKVDIFGVASEENVAHEAAHHITFESETVGYRSHERQFFGMIGKGTFYL